MSVRGVSSGCKSTPKEHVLIKSSRERVSRLQSSEGTSDFQRNRQTRLLQGVPALDLVVPGDEEPR